MTDNTKGRYIYNNNLTESDTHARSVKFEHPKKTLTLNIQLRPNQYDSVPDWVNDNDFTHKSLKMDLTPCYQSFIDSLKEKENKEIEKDLLKTDLTPEEIEQARLELLKLDIPKDFLTDLKNTIDESVKDVLTENTIDENTDESIPNEPEIIDEPENNNSKMEQEIIDNINNSKKKF
jgi:hypothetical protein